MPLDKNDLKQIEKIVTSSVEKSAEQTKKELRKEIRDTVSNSENHIISVITSEVSSLAEINRAVIQRVDKVSELENRIVRLEAKAGIR